MYGHSKATQVWNVKPMHGTRVFNSHLKNKFMIEFTNIIKRTHKNREKPNKEKLNKWHYSHLQSGTAFILDILFHSSIGHCCFKFLKNFSGLKETRLNFLKWERSWNISSWSLWISFWDILVFVLFTWAWIKYGTLYRQCILFHSSLFI